MELVKEISEYKELIRWNKGRLGKVDSNCFLMTKSIGVFIDEQRLYVQKYENGIVLYVDEGNYYNAYYFWKPEAEFADLSKEKPVLIEELDNNGARESYLSSHEQRMIESGFELFKTNLQLERALSDEGAELGKELEERTVKLQNMGLSLSFCDSQKTLEKVLSLWDSALDIADIPQDHKVMSEDAPILCVFDDEKLAAVSWWQHSKSISESRHIVTDPDYYKRGLASTMLIMWMDDAIKNNVGKCLTWISDHNFRSLSMYEKLGFTRNGKISKQYILK